jgi:prolyl-tRNA synthetase
MRISNYFLPILKENPSDASITSHRLMLRAGMIRQLSSGLYNWLPLGLNVLNNVANIVREEMNKAGCLELLMPCLQPAELWLESGRYDSLGKEMLRMKDRHERDLLFSPTNEEVVTDIFRQNVTSYKSLPLTLYQIQWKFRDEIRPRFGVMRGREFFMKDAYSFDIDKESAIASYKRMYLAYYNCFRALGLNTIAVKADSGAIGGDMSQEFHVIASTGESEIFYDKAFDEISSSDEFDFDKIQQLYAAADEKHDASNCPIPADRLTSKRGIEVGHIFYLGTKYSKVLNATINNNKGEQVLAEMGCYGIGVSRLVGAIIEANHDEAGIIWPEEIAPFKVSLINLKVGDALCDAIAENIYQSLTNAKIKLLYDDSKDSIGSKFATHDLIGSPWQIVVGPKSAADNMVEVKNRRSGQKQQMTVDEAINKMIK